jgi:hypothetical protein
MLAERVGFEPARSPPINDLRLFSVAQITRNAQNLSIRYKTSTAFGALYTLHGSHGNGYARLGGAMAAESSARTAGARRGRPRIVVLKHLLA